MPKARSRGLTILGYVLILSSLYQIIVLMGGGYQHYSYLHQEYDKNMILMRYIVSWVIKIAGLAAGIGLLKLIDFFRKFAIFNSFLIICTVNYKHTFAAYSLHTKHLDEVMKIAAGGAPFEIAFSSLTWPALIIQRSIDVVFGILGIYFLTRPRVREQFKRECASTANVKGKIKREGA